MQKDKFRQILMKDENILWAEGVNRPAYIKGSILMSILPCAFFSFFFGIFFGGPASMFNARAGSEGLLKTIGAIAAVLFVVFFGSVVFCTILSSKNTFLAITDKRVIKRSGVFNRHFSHYSLRNVGNVQVVGSAFDSEDSASISVVANDFHAEGDGKRPAARLYVRSLNDAYTAYSKLSEMTQGNNEVIRIKTE